MKYCKECVLPDTRPGLIIENDGICNACKSNKQKEETIDWQKRERAFGEVVDNAKKNNSGYDCVIPVSGGKDSHWQVINCLEAGLTPLAVTWKTPARTRIGYKTCKIWYHLVLTI
ncbi:MAG: hypothetical protein JKY33_00400 [Bacteroidia bacterium]|nr:hypothetical protein [Bacteroidia bacterium]